MASLASLSWQLASCLSFSDAVVFMTSLLWSMRLLESAKLLSTLTFSCCAGIEKEKLAGAVDSGAAGAGVGEVATEAAVVGADEGVTPAAAGAEDGKDAAEGEDLEEAEAAAESLFLRWKLAARSLSRWVFFGDFFFGVEVCLGREFRRHLGLSCFSLG